MLISTTRIAPVGSVLPSSASATSLVRPSAMMPEPTTVATSKAVPIASAASRRCKSKPRISAPLVGRRTTRGEVFDQRRAYFGAALTTLPQHEHEDLAQAREIGAINDAAAEPLSEDQAGARQHRKMGGHRVLRHGKCAGDIASRKPFGLPLDQKPEYFQPRRLGERGKCENGILRFHISRIIDISNHVKQIAGRRNSAYSVATEDSVATEQEGKPMRVAPVRNVDGA